MAYEPPGNHHNPRTREEALLKKISDSMTGLSSLGTDLDLDDFMPEIGFDEAWLYLPHTT